MATRGLVVGPQINSGTSGFSFHGGIDGAILRRALLYWDFLAYPIVNGIGPNLNVLPELQALVRDSVLRLEPVAIDVDNLPDDESGFRVMGIPGNCLPKLYAFAQLTLTQQISARDSIWTFAQSGNQLTLPTDQATDPVLFEYKLTSCLPVPPENVSIESILTFRDRHKADLMRFRVAIEELRQRVVDSADPSRTLTTSLEEIALGVDEIREKMKKAGWNGALETLKVILNVDQSKIMSALFAEYASTMTGAHSGIGLTLSLAANAAITLAQRTVAGGTHIPGDLEGIAYVFRCEEAFNN